MSMASSNENHGDFKSRLDINKDDEDEYPSGEFEYKTPTAWKSFMVNLRMLLAYPWLKVRKGSVLNIKLRGKINDQLKSRFSSGLSLPQLCENLIKAAYDPHISGVYLHIETLKCGWGITEEIRRHILDFRKSGKRKEEIESFINEGVYQIEKLKEDGWITDIKYDDEVTSMLKTRLGIAEKKKLPLIDYKKYSRIKKWSVGLSGGKDRIAVIRASGKIRRVGGSSSSGIIAEQFIKKISKVRDSKRYKAVIIRIDSGGGDALASDLMWREIKLLAESKPVVASMVDMAASGGYYMAMAAHTIVSENLTLTGSIGVVAAKYNKEKLYEKIGFNKEIISKGRYAELFSADRSFRPEEEKQFAECAQNFYKIFRDKAACSRSMSVDKIAQGRVWSGKDAVSRGLVDAIGGFSRAVAIAKNKANIPHNKKVTLVELSKPSLSLQRILFSMLSSAIGIDSTLKHLQDAFATSDGVQARMEDGIMINGSEGSSFADPNLNFLKDCLASL